MVSIKRNPPRDGDAKSWICRTDAYRLADRRKFIVWQLCFVKDVSINIELSCAIEKGRTDHHGRQIKGGNLEADEICENFQISSNGIKNT